MQAYLDTIKEKTGKTIDDFRVLAAPLGFAKHAEVLAWAKLEFGLGHGHANLIAKLVLEPDSFKRPETDRVDGLFAGKKAPWRPLYERLLADLGQLGPDVGTDATDSYVSFVRGGKKFAIVAPTADRLDLGIKLKGEPATAKFEAAGKWNAMVTHRVRIIEAAQVDAEVMAWLGRAYAAVK